MVTFNDVVSSEAIKEYIRQADESLLAIGYTEHSFAHVMKTAKVARYILSALDYDTRYVELAMIAAYLHDIGNMINRADHSQSGALMAFRLLEEMGMSPKELAAVVTAIGNHDEGTGIPVSPIAAALILADKSDVRRSRVRNTDFTTFDIHDRVNYSVTESTLEISEDKKSITLDIIIDTQYSSVMDYFEIFLERMILCRKAAEKLGLRFGLVINGHNLL